jgi:hypothetical protein
LSLVETQIGAFRKRLWPIAQDRIPRYLGTENRPQRVWDKNVTPGLSQSLVDEFNQRIRGVLVSLEKRQEMALPDPRCDLLLATYVLGLTTPFYEDGPAEQHLEAIRNYLVGVMPSDRVAQALLATPADGDDWYATALDPIEAIGRKDGRALFIRYVGADGTAAIQNSHSYQSAPEMNGGFKQESAVTNLRGTAK